MIKNFADKDAARAAWRAWSKAEKPARSSRRQIRTRAAAADTTEILLYEEIGYWGVTAKEFVAAMATITTPNITVRINSPGGDVFDGLAIFNALRNYKGDVSVVVDGLAASAASVIAMAGKTLAMNESSMLMIYRAWALTVGNQNDHVGVAEVLGKIDSQLASIYSIRAGEPVATMLALMDAELWFTAQEAVDLGLADEIVTDAPPDAQAAVDFTIRDAERALRDAGAPRALAKTIIEKGWRGAKRGEPSSAASIDALTASLPFNNRN